MDKMCEHIRVIEIYDYDIDSFVGMCGVFRYMTIRGVVATVDVRDDGGVSGLFVNHIAGFPGEHTMYAVTRVRMTHEKFVSRFDVEGVFDHRDTALGYFNEKFIKGKEVVEDGE